MIEPWFLPGFEASEWWWEGKTASGAAFRAPVLSEAEATSVAMQVRQAALEARRTRSVANVIEAVSAAAARLAGDEAAIRLLAAELGWSARLGRETLTGMSRSWTRDALTRLIESELGEAKLLDGFVEDGDWTNQGRRMRRAAGPPLILQVLAGNVPGVSVTATIRALLARSGVLCKVAEPEPGLLGQFTRFLVEEDPILGRTVAATWWPGREFPDSWSVWAARSRKIVVYGGQGAVQSIRRHTPPRAELIVYGPGIGIAVVLADADNGADALARDVCAYDQQGCVSPRLVYVVGRSAAPFAHRLADALRAETEARPPPDLAPEEAVAIRSLRTEFEFAGYDGSGTLVLAPATDLSWTVLASEKPDIRTEALPRVVRVHAVADLNRLFEILQPLEGAVQAMAYAGSEGLPELANEAVKLGVGRVAPVGTAAWPPSDWRHEGKYQVLPLLSWTDLETHS